MGGYYILLSRLTSMSNRFGFTVFAKPVIVVNLLKGLEMVVGLSPAFLLF